MHTLNYIPGLVSVILPAYNASNYIREAIESILNQTYNNFELIIINDGSTDNTVQIIGTYKDSRIKLINNGENKGLIYSLNRGVELASGEYIARMDADDISLPHRFEKQIEVMNQNSEIAVCGTYINYFGGSNGRFSRCQPKLQDEEIKKSLLIRSAFAHPTVMMRATILKKNGLKYDEKFRSCEDYKLWIDMATYGSFINIPIPLLKYRVSNSQISTQHRNEQLNNTLICQDICFFKEFGFHIDPSGLTLRKLKQLRHLSKKNKYVLAYLYQRLNKIKIIDILYYLLSFDWIKMEKVENIKFIYRFLH